MFQNIKVDIIYYHTNTDFELEFNLCGCCRMRLLTDKATDSKNFVHQLARGVSRSRVIIVIGKLFNDDGIISMISHAIGKKMEVIDNKSYGINTTDEIQIISGSTPLVTGSCYFGGCIIESGPQTIIMLSDNKNIRKSIMHTLIHPYIEELSALDLKEKASAMHEINSVEKINGEIGENTEDSVVSTGDEKLVNDIVNEPVIEQQQVVNGNIASNVMDIVNQGETIVNDENDNSNDLQCEENKDENDNLGDECNIDQTIDMSDVSLEGGMVFTASKDTTGDNAEKNYNNQLYLEPNRVKYTKKSYYADNEYATDTSDYLFDDDNYYRKVNSYKESYISRAILILTIVLLVVAAVLCFTVFYIPAKQGISSAQYLSDTFKSLLG